MLIDCCYGVFGMNLDYVHVYLILLLGYLAKSWNPILCLWFATGVLGEHNCIGCCKWVYAENLNLDHVFWALTWVSV